jgi:catalase
MSIHHLHWKQTLTCTLLVNKPMCPVMNHNRDGAMRHTITKGKINYWPNRFETVPPAKPEEGGYVEFPTKVEGMKVRMNSKKFKEHKNQAELFYNSLSEPEKNHAMAAFAFELDHCDDPIVYERICQRLCEIDLDLAQNVAEMVGADIPTEMRERTKHNKKAKGLSQLDFAPTTPTIATRMVAILIADGFDKVAYSGIKAALTAAGALPFTIAPRRNKIYAAGEDKSNSEGVQADHHLEGQRSTMYDSVFIPGGAKSIETLSKNGRAVHWVREAYGHLKAIGATGEGVDLVRLAVGIPGMEFSTAGDVVESYGVVTASKVDADGFKEALKMAKGAADFVSAYGFAISQHKNFDRELAGLNSMVAY